MTLDGSQALTGDPYRVPASDETRTEVVPAFVPPPPLYPLRGSGPWKVYTSARG